MQGPEDKVIVRLFGEENYPDVPSGAQRTFRATSRDHMDWSLHQDKSHVRHVLLPCIFSSVIQRHCFFFPDCDFLSFAQPSRTSVNHVTFLCR